MEEKELQQAGDHVLPAHESLSPRPGSGPLKASVYQRDEVEKRWNLAVDELASELLGMEDHRGVAAAIPRLRSIAERLSWCREEGSRFPLAGKSCVSSEVLARWKKAAAHLKAPGELAREIRDLFDHYDLLQGADVNSAVSAGIHYAGI